MAVVPAPTYSPPAVGLIPSADTRRDGDPDWQRGSVQWAPEGGEGYSLVSVCSTAEADHAGERLGLAEAEPFVVRVRTRCATFGGASRDDEARLNRALDNAEGYAIARELWTGELTRDEVTAGAYPAPNAYLTNGDATNLTPGGAVPIAYGIGLLEQAMGGALLGGQGMIHAPRLAAARLGSYVRESGSLRLTEVDNLVVLDAGYPATGLTADSTAEPGTAYLFGTGLVVVRRGPVSGETGSDAPRIARVNRTELERTRPALVTFDQRAHFVVHVQLDDTTTTVQEMTP